MFLVGYNPKKRIRYRRNHDHELRRALLQLLTIGSCGSVVGPHAKDERHAKSRDCLCPLCRVAECTAHPATLSLSPAGGTATPLQLLPAGTQLPAQIRLPLAVLLLAGVGAEAVEATAAAVTAGAPVTLEVHTDNGGGGGAGAVLAGRYSLLHSHLPAAAAPPGWVAPAFYIFTFPRHRLPPVSPDDRSVRSVPCSGSKVGRGPRAGGGAGGLGRPGLGARTLCRCPFSLACSCKHMGGELLLKLQADTSNSGRCRRRPRHLQ